MLRKTVAGEQDRPVQTDGRLSMMKFGIKDNHSITRFPEMGGQAWCTGDHFVERLHHTAEISEECAIDVDAPIPERTQGEYVG
jgi:hypothetical protein